MSFLSRDEFKQLANGDLDKLYDYLTEKFNVLEIKIEKQIQVIQVQESKIKELEARLNQNSKNSHKPPSSDIFKKDRDRKTSRRKSGGQAGHEGSNLWITDYNGHTIRKMVLSTGVVTTIAGSPLVSGFVNDTGSAARFNLPSELASDGTSLYVWDRVNSVIRKIQ